LSRVRIKICGITRPEDALHAAAEGADAIGLVFHNDSPRVVTSERANAIACALPPFVARTGLFVDAEAAFVRSMLTSVPLDLLQFHGDEPPAYCRAFGRPYIKAIRMAEGVDLPGIAREYADAAALLLDAHVPGSPGGTGRTFDWERVPVSLRTAVILAGGLTPQNVAEAIRRVRPWAVDVSGGVESAKGVKDPARVTAFIEAVRQAG
jgi:phosphoribosylanthranilate isomerase